FLLFNKLYSNVAVCFHAGRWQLLREFQGFVVPEHAVMGKGKGFPISLPGKWVIILIAFFAALCRHTGVTHHNVYTARNMQMHLVSRERPLVNPHASGEVVGNAGGVRATYLAFPGERVQDFVLLSCSEFLVVVN